MGDRGAGRSPDPPGGRRPSWLLLVAGLILVGLTYSAVRWRLGDAARTAGRGGAGPGEVDSASLAALGERLVTGRGGCLVCHTFAGMGNFIGPHLDGIGARAATRSADAEAYILQSLLDPEAYLVEGFPALMPAADQSPAALNAGEVKVVAAFLQSLGGQITIHVTPTELEAVRVETTAGTSAPSGLALLHKKGCTGCHDLESETRRVGPALARVGERLSPAQILTAIVNPGGSAAPGFGTGGMPETYGRDLSSEELGAMVRYLVSLSGGRAQ